MPHLASHKGRVMVAFKLESAGKSSKHRAQFSGEGGEIH